MNNLGWNKFILTSLYKAFEFKNGSHSKTFTSIQIFLLIQPSNPQFPKVIFNVLYNSINYIDRKVFHVYPTRNTFATDILLLVEHQLAACNPQTHFEKNLDLTNGIWNDFFEYIVIRSIQVPVSSHRCQKTK